MEILFSTAEDWRAWLEEFGEREREIWLIYYKKHTGKKSVTYDQAVRQALCFGWIDSKVKSIDEERYMQKYTQRKASSNWSESNKRRVEELTEAGLMMPSGIAAIEQAKKNGSWDNLKDIDDDPVEPDDLLAALEKNTKAMENYFAFPRSTRKQYLWWLKSAKGADTRSRRIMEIVKRSKEGRKAGI